MKLYYTPGACSLAPHIVIEEAGLKVNMEKVDLATKLTETGVDYMSVNDKGYVPALMRDDGTLLTEVSAIVQYLADIALKIGSLPAASLVSSERYRLQEWLGFISTELHKPFGLLYSPVVPDAFKVSVKESIGHRLSWLEKKLEGRPFLMGDDFTVADAYLFTVLNWAAWLNLDLKPWSAVSDYKDRIGRRPAVVAALKAEGLIQ